MKLNPQFSQFMAAIRPTDRQKEDWRTGSKTLRDRLEADATLADIFVATFLQGSVRRSTAVRPSGDKRPDVDVVVVTTIDHVRESPGDAMARFVPFLEKHYQGKWEPQGRSFGIELSYVDLDLVITALPAEGNERQLLSEFYKTDAVQTLSTLDERSDWRLSNKWMNDAASGSAVLSKSDELPDQDWKPHPLWLPDREVNYWGRTHPIAQIRWTADKNRACGGHYVNVVRAIKWWRLHHAEKLPKYPKGYPLEHMIGYTLPDGIESIAEGVTAVFEGMVRMWHAAAVAGQVPFLADHGVPEHDVLKRLEVTDFRAFIAAAGLAAATARSALESDDAAESGRLWRELFGPSFPFPGPSGGDRGGFNKPSGPIVPPPSDRFA
jgi:hypothetical protein